MNSKIGNDNNFHVMHTPPTTNLKRTHSVGSHSSIKTSKSLSKLLKNEQDYNLIGHFRNIESQQLDDYRKSRKNQVQQMLKSN